MRSNNSKITSKSLKGSIPQESTAFAKRGCENDEETKGATQYTKEKGFLDEQ